MYMSKLMNLFGLVLCGLTLNLNLAAAENRRPVKVELPAEALAQLEPGDRAQIVELMQIIAARLWTWDSLDTVPPQTSLQANTEVIPLGTLFKPIKSDEPLRIGNQSRHFSPEQLSDISHEAIFKVPSADHPGRFYTWKLNAFFLIGAKQIEVKWQEAKEFGIDQLVVSIPRRLVGYNFLSLSRGLENLYKNSRDIISLVVGLKEKAPTYSQDQIDALVLNRRKELARMQPNTIFNDILSANKSVQEANKAERKVETVLASIEQKVFDIKNPVNVERWQRIASETREAVKANPETTEDQAFVWANTMMQAELVEEFYSQVRLNKELVAIGGKDLPQKLVNYGRLLVLVRAAEAEMREMNESVTKSVQAEIRAAHSIRSRDHRWLHQETDKKMASWYRTTLTEKIVKILAAAPQESAEAVQEIQSQLNFLNTQAPELSANLKAEMSAIAERSWDVQIWNKSNWRVEKDTSGKFRLVQNDTYVVTTGQLFWRLSALGNHVRWAWKNGLYNLLVRNLWNGNLGFRSWLGSEPFQYEWAADPETGAVELTNKTRQTTSSLVAQSWQHGEKLIADLYQTPGSGMFGKRGDRIMLFFKADLLYRGLLPIGISAVKTVGTVVNAIGSGTLATTSLAWAPLSGLLTWASNATLLDRYLGDGPELRTSGKWFRAFRSLRLFPAVASGLGLVKGAAQFTGAGTMGVAGHPALALTAGGFGIADRGLSHGFEWIMNKVIGKFARIPGKDTYMANIVSGPGLDSNYFYSITPTVALGGILASLEVDQVAKFRSSVNSKVTQPSREAQKIIGNYQILFGSMNSNSSPLLKDIWATEQNLNKEVESNYAGINKVLEGLTVLPNNTKNKVRLSAEALAELRARATQLVESFVTTKVLTRLDPAAYWKKEDLAVNDWAGLADKYLTSVFGNNILEALDPSSDSFVVSVRDDGLEDWLSGAIGGYIPELGTKLIPPGGDLVKRSDKDKSTPLEAMQPDVHGLNLSCADLLMATQHWQGLVK